MITGIILEQFRVDLPIEKKSEFFYPYNRHRQGVCEVTKFTG
jgi:hypothetical protein